MATKTDKTDHGQAEVQEKKAEEKGFLGTKVDPIPNEAYSLKSGPDSPPAVEHDRVRVDQRLLAKEEK